MQGQHASNQNFAANTNEKRKTNGYEQNNRTGKNYSDGYGLQMAKKRDKEWS